MRSRSLLVLLVPAALVGGCNKEADSRIHVREGIRSDTLASNIVTRPVRHAFSALIGEGIMVDEAVTRRNEAGLLELYVNGHNEAYNTKRFRYRVEWLDADGLLIETRATTWLPASSMGKSPFTIKAVAPRAEAVDFRMDTRKWE
ncbi:MAG: YcfL family protein [Phycisphaerales bacterium]|nr:MAG: YcfL family protein [Phycisphaerales bacterium]